MALGVGSRGNGGGSNGNQSDGLNPNRQRGFGGRIDTPSLKDMRSDRP